MWNVTESEQRNDGELSEDITIEDRIWGENNKLLTAINWVITD